MRRIFFFPSLLTNLLIISQYIRWSSGPQGPEQPDCESVEWFRHSLQLQSGPKNFVTFPPFPSHGHEALYCYSSNEGHNTWEIPRKRILVIYKPVTMLFLFSNKFLLWFWIYISASSCFLELTTLVNRSNNY